jgi:hypothetical protein
MGRSETSRCDQYRDLLETWAEWWNNVGRASLNHYILPPLDRTAEALACSICAGLDDEMNGERCQVCGRRGRS